MLLRTQQLQLHAPPPARSVSHLLRALEQFQALGIDFVSLSENVDTSTPTGKMVFTILGAVAELERIMIVERVKAGIRNARAKGKKIGRPGTKVNPAAVLMLRSEGESVRAIAAQLNSSVGTVSRILAASAQSAGNLFGGAPCLSPSQNCKSSTVAIRNYSV